MAAGAEPRPAAVPALPWCWPRHSPSTPPQHVEGGSSPKPHAGHSYCSAEKGLPARDTSMCLKLSALPGLVLGVQNLTPEQLSAENTL